MRQNNVVPLVVAVTFLAGCASLQNLAVDDLRTQEHFYREIEIPMGIEEISQALYTHSTKCRSLPRLSVNPNNKGEAQITVEGMGLTKASVIIVMDFRERSEHQTDVKTYSYYSMWHGHVDDIISAIQQPNSC